MTELADRWKCNRCGGVAKKHKEQPEVPPRDWGYLELGEKYWDLCGSCYSALLAFLKPIKRGQGAGTDA